MDDIWNEMVKNKQYSDSQELVNYIKDNPEHNLYLFESFVNISFNKVLSQLYIKNQFKKIMTEEFSSFVNNILPNFKITDNASKLIELFFTQQKCETLLYKTEIINLDAKEYEIYLYAFYFALICSLNKDSFYGSLFSNKIQTLLKDNYIPGGEPNEEQILISYYIYQTTQKSSNQGFYICGGTKDKPCGTFYQISPCGLPSQEFTCSNCDAKIAGKHHKLTKETDYRIYYDENELKAAKKSFKEANEIKYKFFSDFENEIKDKITKSIKGMNRVSYQFFNGNIKKVRKMKTIVYRVLNFILYSCIHFAKHLGYINENNINQFIPYKIINKKCSPLKTFDVIKDNWKNIKECLTDEKDIFIFMNMLLNNTSFKQEIHNCSIQLNEQQRDSFEDAISKIIVKDENYDEFAKTYSSQRQNLLLKLNDSALQLENIINQTIVSLPSEIQNEFPQYNYFHLSTFPSENSLKTYLQNHNDVDFPLLQAYLHQKESFDFLKQLTYLNPVVNYIHDECDFKLSRSEMNSKKLTECSKITSHEFKEKLDNFRRAFNKFSELDLQYECKKINNKYKIDLNKVKETPIGYFLVDNGSIRSYGIYLTAIYELLANRQNGIINSITRNKTTEIANHLKEYLEQEVMIQDANEEEILSMEYNNNNSMFNSFEEMISYFSEPCFFDNEITEIVYSKYKDISFDLTQIETQLVNVLLPGKKKLSWEDLRYINFKYEGYANNKSKIIDNYNKMYNKEELGEKTKAEILKYMNKCNCREKIYDCLQYLLHYIYRKEFPPNTKIKDVIKDSEYSDKNEFNNLLKAIKKEILVTEIINFIELIEDKFFDDFKENISPLYNDKLEDEEHNKLKEWMKNSKEDQVITPKHLRNSLKKFILRFLCTQREEGILPPEQDLIIRLLNNESIWEYFVVMHPHFEIEKKDLNNTFNRVKLNCTLDFYEKLNSEINHIAHK